MSSPEIRQQFRYIASLLKAAANVASGTGHAVTTGLLREKLIHQFLKPHLPRDIEIRSGVIIDAYGTHSTQQDCVLVDTRLPLVDVGSSTEAVFLAESVLATVEIKSRLDAADIDSILDATAQMLKLVRKVTLRSEKGGVEIRQANVPIVNYVFAFDGASPETLKASLITGGNQRQDGRCIPAATCVLSKGVVLRDSLLPVIKETAVYLPPTQTVVVHAKSLTHDALLAFYRRLLDDIGTLRLAHFDLDPY